MSDRANLELELFELLSANEKATSWGAAVGARSERIKQIESELRRMDPSTGAPQAPAPVTTTVKACAEFIKWALQEGSWEGGDLDGGSIQDKAEALGLVVKVEFDPAKHDDISLTEYHLDREEFAMVLAALSWPKYGGWEVTDEMVERAARQMCERQVLININLDDREPTQERIDRYVAASIDAYREQARDVLTAALARNDRGSTTT